MKRILSLLLLVCFVSLASSTAVYTLNDSVDIKVVCINEGYCSNTSYCNINIQDPDNVLIVEGQNMTNQGSFHNYTITPSKTGQYKVTGFCLDSPDSKEIDFPFTVSKSGEILTTSDTLNYIAILIFAFILFSGSIYIFYVTPFSDKTDDLGRTILINKAKYIKLAFVPISYGFFIWILNLLMGLANNYLNYTIFSGYMTMLFNFFIYIGYGLFIVWLVAFMYHLLYDIYKWTEIEKWGYAVK